MSEKSAFPESYRDEGVGGGMTLREYVAIKAMRGVVCRDEIGALHSPDMDLLAILEQYKEGWQPIETAPKVIPILIHYTNSCGNGRTVKAYYIEKFTEESSDDSDNYEYNEADDTYYIVPGWYEMIDNWDDYSSVAIQYDPTYWMPLPEPPK